LARRSRRTGIPGCLTYYHALFLNPRREDPAWLTARLLEVGAHQQTEERPRRLRRLARSRRELERRLADAEKVAAYDWEQGEREFVEQAGMSIGIPGILERWRAAGIPARARLAARRRHWPEWPGPGEGGPLTLLDEVLPSCHFRERHSAATRDPLRALAAVREVTFAQLPLTRTLFRLRGLPSSAPTVWEAMIGIEFGETRESAHELVLAGVGQPWRLRTGLRAGDDFASFNEPGYAKMAISVAARAGRLETETRVLLTDAASRRRFRAYWLVVRPFSGLIRREWLRAAVRRAGS
jgi:hypothetical protein